MRPLLGIFYSLLLLYHTASVFSECSLSLGKQTIDLASLQRKAGEKDWKSSTPSSNKRDNVFYWNYCSPLADTYSCGNTNAAIVIGDYMCNQIAKPSDATLSWIDSMDPEKGIILAYAGGLCEGDFQYTITVEHYCDNDKEGEITSALVSDLGCNVVIQMNTRHVCLQSEKSVHSKDSKLSLGSIILITLSSISALYLIVGISLNAIRGNKGLNIIPHKSFWLSLLPGLIKDGIIFTVRKIRRTTSHSYSQLNS